eukprot:1764972-Prymnesium_polylepis.3
MRSATAGRAGFALSVMGRVALEVEFVVTKYCTFSVYSRHRPGTGLRLRPVLRPQPQPSLARPALRPQGTHTHDSAADK